jgi:hypothetical protein
MNKRTMILTALIVLAALMRMVPHPWNFWPMIAVAVFAGIRLSSRFMTPTVPLLALFLSDLGLEALHRCGLWRFPGLYSGMWLNYSTIALIALMSLVARGTRSPWVIASTTLAGSCIFFVISNFGVWLGNPLKTGYPHTMVGLMTCYIAGLPFFGTMVVGDLLYAAVIFGAWELLEGRFPVLRPKVAAVGR